jgi:hypothetical protein
MKGVEVGTLQHPTSVEARVSGKKEDAERLKGNQEGPDFVIDGGDVEPAAKKEAYDNAQLRGPKVLGSTSSG